MSTHNIGFYEDFIKVVLQLSSNIITYSDLPHKNYRQYYFSACTTATLAWPYTWVQSNGNGNQSSHPIWPKT